MDFNQFDNTLKRWIGLLISILVLILFFYIAFYVIIGLVALALLFYIRRQMKGPGQNDQHGGEPPFRIQ